MPLLQRTHVILAVHRLNQAQCAPLATPRHAGQLTVVRFLLAAIGDHEFAPGPVASFNHRGGSASARCHRLFAQNVLARRGSALGGLAVECVSNDDIDNVNLRVVPQALQTGVVLGRAVGQPVLLGDREGFDTAAADQGGRSYVTSSAEPGQHLFE